MAVADNLEKKGIKNIINELGFEEELMVGFVPPHDIKTDSRVYQN